MTRSQCPFRLRWRGLPNKRARKPVQQVCGDRKERPYGVDEARNVRVKSSEVRVGSKADI